jgi:hypothetical protein
MRGAKVYGQPTSPYGVDVRKNVGGDNTNYSPKIGKQSSERKPTVCERPLS